LAYFGIKDPSSVLGLLEAIGSSEKLSFFALKSAGLSEQLSKFQKSKVTRSAATRSSALWGRQERREREDSKPNIRIGEFLHRLVFSLSSLRSCYRASDQKTNEDRNCKLQKYQENPPAEVAPAPSPGEGDEWYCWRKQSEKDERWSE